MNEITHEQAYQYIHTGQAHLDPAQRAALAIHLGKCKACQEYARLQERLAPLIAHVMHTRWDGYFPRNHALNVTPSCIRRSTILGHVFTYTNAAILLALLILGLMVAITWGRPPTSQPAAPVIPGKGKSSSSSPSTPGLERLYILSEIPNPDGSGSSVAGRVTVLNMAAQREIVSIKAGVDVDAVPSADGRRLYVAGVDEAADGPGVDHLFAVDTRTGSEIWRVSLSRVKYIGGGPSTLAISSDGSQLYVYSYPWLELDKYSAGQVPDWIEILDANTGQALADTVPLPDCGAAGLPAPAVAGTLYVVCYDSKDVRFINTKTFQVEQRVKIPGASGLPGKTGGIVSSVESPDGRKLYVVTSDWRVAVVDLKGRALLQVVDLGGRDKGDVAGRLVALSRDGRSLLIGESIQNGAGKAIAHQLHLFDTQSWNETHNIRVDEPLAETSLAFDPDGRSVYGITTGHSNTPFPGTDTILKINLTDDSTNALLARKGEGIMRIFFGP